MANLKISVLKLRDSPPDQPSCVPFREVKLNPTDAFYCSWMDCCFTCGSSGAQDTFLFCVDCGEADAQIARSAKSLVTFPPMRLGCCIVICATGASLSTYWIRRWKRRRPEYGYVDSALTARNAEIRQKWVG